MGIKSKKQIIRSKIDTENNEVYVNMNDLIIHISETLTSTKEIEILKYQLMEYKKKAQS